MIVNHLEADPNKCYMQEGCGFLTPRGKKERGASSQKKRDKGQSTGISTSQRGTYSINRAVMVGNSIQPDSNASDTKKRPLYFTPGEGENESALV